jgi:hypothetical protein
VVETTGATGRYAAIAAKLPVVACYALIELTKSRGGFNNIIVQILKFENLDAM